MIDYVAFYLNTSTQVVPIECVEIQHPSFPQPFRFVKDEFGGGSTVLQGQTYEYKPMRIDRSNVTNDLDQKFSLTLEDLDDVLFSTLNAIPFESTVNPTFKYFIFRSDDLDEPLAEMQTLDIASFSKDSTGLLTFDAEAPVLNNAKTGQVYTVEDYPLLQGAQQ